MQLSEYIGKQFGRLTIKKIIPKFNRSYFLCDCICGKEVSVKPFHLKSGATKSCGCYASEISRLTGKSNKGRRLPNALAAKRVLYSRYSKDSKGYEFKLTFDQFIELTSSNCFYCNTKPNRVCKPKKSQQDGYTYNGIDRLDNNLGYIQENVVPCCFTCNSKKGKMSVNEFYNWLNAVIINIKDKI